MSASSSPSDTTVGSGSSTLTSERAQSGHELSSLGDGRSRDSMLPTPGAVVGKTGKPRWLNQIRDWLSVSEPSAQAMKTQKKITYKKHGIELNDPKAAAKLHLPIGKLPEGAITSTSGPSPEKALKRAQEQIKRQSYSTISQGSQSVSSSIFSVPSTKESNHATPWEN